MRGEDRALLASGGNVTGSPPHARGRRDKALRQLVVIGITPACAGKTRRAISTKALPRDHPRMRGEDRQAGADKCNELGSPPHARGRHTIPVRALEYTRITPACAGKTLVFGASHSRGPDHPRMRGEDVRSVTPSSMRGGSPPHARGRPQFPKYGEFTGRITPACAGKTRLTVGSEALAEDHPRMRGEDVAEGVANVAEWGSPPHARGRQLDFPGNPAKSFSSLPVFFCSQPSPLGWFLRWVLGLGSSLWKQR